MINKLFKITKKLYWFEARFIYTKNGYRVFDYVCQIGLHKLEDSLNRRLLRKITQPLHKNNKVKKMLDNGVLDIEILCYLGKFSKKKKL